MQSRFAKKNSGANKKRVFLIINGVNISLMLICSCLSYTQRKDRSNNSFA